ncbi:MAG: cytochrome c biogenesis CcdA family protein [Thermoproteota archaeon]
MNLVRNDKSTLLLLMFFQSIIFFSFALCKAYPSPNNVTVYYFTSESTSCPLCSATFEKFNEYLGELKESLNSIGVQNIHVKIMKNEEANLVYKKFNISSSMYSSVVVDADDKYFFVNFIPPKFIADFLFNFSESYKRILVYRDEASHVLVVLDDKGNRFECNETNSFSKCITKKQVLSQDVYLQMLSLGIALGLADGSLNPCAISVLIFLLAYLLSLGSKKKCIKIGLTYSFIIFLVYFSFMYGILKLISIVGYLDLIRTIVSISLVIFGLIEVKDFFFYGKGISLSIPKSSLPTIEKLVKAATVPSAIVLGVFVSFVEIPCAGSFPIAYIASLASRGIEGSKSIPYILLYNFFFVLPLVLLTLITYFSVASIERAEKARQKLRVYMRLISGLIMILLAILMLERWL